jgi:very-short-patch-repair endonuclease/DNA-directed RNA polymerase subunit RPC12/RpoP
MILKGGFTQIPLLCSKCHHPDECTANLLDKQGCPYCTTNPMNRKLCDKDSCRTCFERSFASHPESEHWDWEKNEESPREIFRQSNKKYYFRFPCCFHSNCIDLGHIIGGVRCGYCSNPPKNICDCEKHRSKIFACASKHVWDLDYDELEKQRGPDPMELFEGAGVKMPFKCRECDSKFSQKLDNLKKRGLGCPYCKNKTEQIVYDFLKKHFDNVVRQFKPEWCRSTKTNALLSFDFYLLDQQVIVEVDGLQHFQSVSNWSDVNKTHEYDLYKMQKANAQEIKVVRIFQENVVDNSIDWKHELLEAIKSGNKNRFIPSHYYEENFHTWNHSILQKKRICSFRNCGEQFDSYSEYQKHRRSHRGEPDIKCSWPGCEFKTFTKQNMDKHDLFHSQKKPHQCPHCIFRCNRNSHLKSHIQRLHGGNAREYPCNQCDKTFKTSDNLLKHKIRHDPEKKKFICTEENCTRDFFDKRELESHVLTHTQEKPHQCSKCTRRFNRIRELQDHDIRKHGGKKSRTCLNDDCFYVCITSQEMKRHVKNRHM